MKKPRVGLSSSMLLLRRKSRMKAKLLNDHLWRGLLILFLIGAHLALLGPGSPAYGQEILPDGLVGMFERNDGGYFTLVDEATEEEVTKAARGAGYRRFLYRR